MTTDAKGKAPTRTEDANLGRSQAIFIAVGVGIVLGGLWLLYDSTGPYHPDQPISEIPYQGATGS